MGVYTSESLSHLSKEQWVKMKEAHERDLEMVRSESFYPKQHDDITEITENIEKLKNLIKHNNG